MLYYAIINDVNKVLKVIKLRSNLKDNRYIKIAKGQVLAWRTYSYFYLIRLYQDTYVGN
ncbi:MAG: RagB/SusD family nutrient uptake outer membrane protein [Flavobacteriales bacterium AspAUS03]